MADVKYDGSPAKPYMTPKKPSGTDLSLGSPMGVLSPPPTGKWATPGKPSQMGGRRMRKTRGGRRMRKTRKTRGGRKTRHRRGARR